MKSFPVLLIIFIAILPFKNIFALNDNDAGNLNVSLSPSSSALDCNQNLVIDLSATHNGNPGTSTFLWSGPGINGSTQQTEVAAIAGTYSVTVTDSSNNCSGSASVVITGSVDPPDINAGPSGVLTCIQPTHTLQGSSSTPNVSYSWTGPGGFVGSNPTEIVSQSGVYTLQVIDLSNSCFITSSVTVEEDFQSPNLTVLPPGILTCNQTTVTLIAQSNTPNVTYLWSDQSGSVFSTAPVVDVCMSGTYNVEVTNQNNGCVETDDTMVFEDTQMPIADAGADQDINCALNSTVSLGGSNSTVGSSITYEWFDVNGGLLGNTPSVVVSAVQGQYTLTVTDTNNGCTDMDVVEVTCNCITNLNVSAFPVPDGTYKAFLELESASLVPANGVVTFQAGDKVTLHPGFKTGMNANFKALIEVCQ